MTRRKAYCDCHEKIILEKDKEYTKEGMFYYCSMTGEPCEAIIKDN